jgi:hypothetical protein
MVEIKMEVLKNSPQIIEDIRWDVTPRIFVDPVSAPSADSGEAIDITYGYMLYVDLIHDKPAVVIMQLKRIMSKTVGYVHDIPEDMLHEAMRCDGRDCVSGMYPLSGTLEAWLKKEFGLS